jgi:serine/threonine protein kinase
MGQVFKARHQHMDRFAAIKLLPTSLTKDEAAVKRFQREVKAAAKLSHPNIVQTYDAGVQRGVWYLVMEYVDGQDLSALVKQRARSPSTTRRIASCKRPVG